MINSEPYTITTRHTYSGLPIQKATQFAAEQLAGFGLEVEVDAWQAGHQPKHHRHPARSKPARRDLFLSAHLDNMPPGPHAPGADDNASGASAVLLAAELLSQLQPECTFQFALWTGEEQGLLGSAAWAKTAAAQDKDIRGVLNLDMIAYDSDEAPIVDLHARSDLPGSVALARLFAGVVDTYALNLEPDVLVDDWLGDYSDNKRFWDEGYSAILAIEDNDDFTPYYHTTDDTLATLNMPYFTEFARASLGTFLHMSGCLNEGQPTVVHLPLVLQGQ